MIIKLKIYSTGTREWYKGMKLHREVEPAVIEAGGVKFWYINGKNTMAEFP